MMARAYFNSWLTMGRALQFLAALILMVAPALDSAAYSAERSNPPAPVIQLLPAWLDVVDDPLDHPTGQLAGSHCNQTQLTKFLPADDQTFLQSTKASLPWRAVFTTPVPQACPASLDPPPRS